MANSASLAAQNKAALDYFIQNPVTTQMITYLARKATAVIRCEPPAHFTSGALPTPPLTPPSRESTAMSGEPGLPSLEEFIASIVQQSHVQIPTLMPALIYLARLRERLPPVAQGIPSTVHRIFLAALILAAKNLNDSSPKNKHWARYTSVPGYPDFAFTNSEVNLMEKQLLGLLDWDLRITNDDLYFHLEPFLAPIRIKQQQQAERKMQAMLREREQQQRNAQLQQAQAQYEFRQQQRKHAQSISILASAHAQLALPHIVSQARLSRSREPYDSPIAAATQYPTASPAPPAPVHSYSKSNSLLYPASRSSSSRAPPTRTPSLSPPTRCDSSASYASSVSASPASFIAYPPSQATYNYQLAISHPTKPQEAKIQMVNYDLDTYQQCRGQELPQIPRTVHIPVAADKSLPPWPGSDETIEKPAKKLKTSAGNLLSRFLGHAAAQAGVMTAC